LLAAHEPPSELPTEKSRDYLAFKFSVE